jgi:hypothetical protein
MKRITLFGLMLALCMPTFAAEQTAREMSRSLGEWALDAVQAGMQNEQIQEAIRTRARKILAKNGIELPHYPEDEHTHERTEKKNGPPDWAPAHGWRKKFSATEEEELGHHLCRKVSEGVRGDDLVVVLRQQIERVSKGGKIGDDPKVKGDKAQDKKPSDKGKNNVGKSRSKGRGGK